tara:strand:+ start:4871 stop:5761 length:891 start_codon:yes stop_codon:yes gene_type:complete
MSEEISNPSTVVDADNGGTDVDTSNNTDVTTQTQEISPEDVATAVRSKIRGTRDRVGEALDQAKNGPVSFDGEATVESLTSVEGLDEGGHKGIDFNRVIKELPEDAQKMLANIRADYTRKTQELSSERKKLENLQSSMLADSFTSSIDEIAGGETVELDPYNTKSFESRIEQEVAKRMQQMLQPVREEQEVLRKRTELQQFKNEHPDLMEYKEDIAKMLTERESVSLQDAYYMVKGKHQVKENKKLKEELDSRTTRMREVGLKMTTSGARGQAQIPKHIKKPHEIYAWLKANKGKK